LFSSDEIARAIPREGWPAIRKSRVLFGVLTLWVASCLFSAAILPGQDSKRTDSQRKADAESATAQQAFATSCAGCHGLDGKGGERAPDIVTRPNIRQLSDTDLLRILQKGVPLTSMPAFSYLGDPALRSLVSHLRKLQGDAKPENLSGDARRGKQLFFGKGECSRCHMARGEGGFFASDLTGYARGRAPETIRDAIVFPNRDLDPRNRTVVVTLPNGKTVEGIARNEDNFSIQVLAQDGSIYLLAKPASTSFRYRNESPMPADYGTRLSAGEVDDLVNYLYSLTKENLKKDKSEEEQDED